MSSWFHVYARVNLFLTGASFKCWKKEWRLRTSFHRKTSLAKPFLIWGFPFIEIRLYFFFSVWRLCLENRSFHVKDVFNRKKNPILLFGHYLYLSKYIVFACIWICYWALVSGCCVDCRSLTTQVHRNCFSPKIFNGNKLRDFRARLCIGVTLK